MISDLYIRLGFDHILDPNGYDHILFVVALCSIYNWKEWKKVVILVTAFTIGHSLTLALSSLRIVNISSALIETLIPITILITCLYNILKVYKGFKNEKVNINYILALFFGLIHGLGFSNFLKPMFNKDESIIGPLLSFNIGVELGQLVIVLGVLLLSLLWSNVLKIQLKYLNY